MRKQEERTAVALRAGFTLMEILVAVAIIGILGTVAVTNIISNIEKAKGTAAKASVDNISNAVTQYYLSNKKYPSTLRDLIQERGDDEAILKGGEGALEDPWGTEYKYEKKGARKFVVISAGPDTEFGTDDDVRSDTTKKSSKE
jgi:type II secretion system protein G